MLYNCTLYSFHFYLVYMSVLPALQGEGGLLERRHFMELHVGLLIESFWYLSPD